MERALKRRHEHINGWMAAERERDRLIDISAALLLAGELKGFSHTYAFMCTKKKDAE